MSAAGSKRLHQPRHARRAAAPASTVGSNTRGTRNPRSASPASSRRGERTCRSTSGGLPHKRAAARHAIDGARIVFEPRAVDDARRPVTSRATTDARRALKPPPGVGQVARFLSRGRSRSRERVDRVRPVAGPDGGLRGGAHRDARQQHVGLRRGSRHGFGAASIARDLGDRFGVEHRVVALEQPRDARLVDLHLQAADAERAEHDDAVALGARCPARRRPRCPAAARR